MQSANWIASVSLLPVPLPGLFEDPQAVVANAQLIATAAMTRFRMAAEHTDRLVTERLRPYPSRSPDSASISIGQLQRAAVVPPHSRDPGRRGDRYRPTSDHRSPAGETIATPRIRSLRPARLGLRGLPRAPMTRLGRRAFAAYPAVSAGGRFLAGVG
jgi:hypothetical protein